MTSDHIWYFLGTGNPCRQHGNAEKQLKLMGIITRMQIQYQIMLCKPRSCIDIELANFDTKCKAWMCRSASAQVKLPTELRMY